MFHVHFSYLKQHFKLTQGDLLYKDGDFSRRVSDCEELSGGLLTGDDGFIL